MYTAESRKFQGAPTEVAAQSADSNDSPGYIAPGESSTQFPKSPEQWRTRRKAPLTDEKRAQIWSYHKENPLVTHADIAAFFGVERSTVSKIVHQTQYEDASAECHNNVPESGPSSVYHGQYLDAQQALIDWVQDQQQKGISLTRAIVRKKAAIFAATAWDHNKKIAEGSNTLKVDATGLHSSEGYLAESNYGPDFVNYQNRAHWGELPNDGSYSLDLAGSENITAGKEKDSDPWALPDILNDIAIYRGEGSASFLAGSEVRPGPTLASKQIEGVYPSNQDT